MSDLSSTTADAKSKTRLGWVNSCFTSAARSLPW